LSCRSPVTIRFSSIPLELLTFSESRKRLGS
jgi:hypothetical protein